MKTPINLIILISIFIISGCSPSPAPIGEMQFPEGSVQHVVNAEDITWNPCPPHLPAGCEITILEGDPKGSDLFTVRFQVTDEFYMPPHTHPKDERVTVIAGKVAVAFGADAERKDAKVFGPGDYYVNSRDAIHSVWADTTTIIQITGIGPWEAHFVEQ